jgi:hypothetical protein
MFIYVATSDFAKAHKAFIIGSAKSLKDTLSGLQKNTPPLAEAQAHKVRYVAVWHTTDKERDVLDLLKTFDEHIMDTKNTEEVTWYQFKKDNFMEQIEEIVNSLINKYRIF